MAKDYSKTLKVGYFSHQSMMWSFGSVVENQDGTPQVVLFVDNDGTFKCMDFEGNEHTYSVNSYHQVASNIKAYIKAKYKKKKKKSINWGIDCSH